MSQLPILKLGKQWISKQQYRATIFIGDKQYRMPKPVGAVWSDIVLASKNKAFARGDMIVNVRGELYRICEKMAKPLKIKKGEFVKKIDFQDDPTSWLVYPSQALYADPKTRTSDDLL
jgi:hypothetical protein